MKRAPLQLIAERWAEHLRLYREGAAYSAFVRLAEIFHCLEHETLPEQDASKWRAAIQNVSVTEFDLRSVRADGVRHVERLQRLFDVGSTYTFEELLLAITTRVELELLSRFFAERGVADIAEVALLDEGLLAIAASSANASAFRSAQATAKKNWGIPLHSKWLENDSLH